MLEGRCFKGALRECGLWILLSKDYPPPPSRVMWSEWFRGQPGAFLKGEFSGQAKKGILLLPSAQTGENWSDVNRC